SCAQARSLWSCQHLPLLRRRALQLEREVVRLHVARADRHVDRAALDADRSALTADAQVALVVDVLRRVVEHTLARDRLRSAHLRAFECDRAVDLALAAVDAGLFVDVAVARFGVDVQRVRRAVGQTPRGWAHPPRLGSEPAARGADELRDRRLELHLWRTHHADALYRRASDRRMPARAVDLACEAAYAQLGVGDHHLAGEGILRVHRRRSAAERACGHRGGTERGDAGENDATPGDLRPVPTGIICHGKDRLLLFLIGHVRLLPSARYAASLESACRTRPRASRTL